MWAVCAILDEFTRHGRAQQAYFFDDLHAYFMASPSFLALQRGVAHGGAYGGLVGFCSERSLLSFLTDNFKGTLKGWV